VSQMCSFPRQPRAAVKPIMGWRKRCDPRSLRCVSWQQLRATEATAMAAARSAITGPSHSALLRFSLMASVSCSSVAADHASAAGVVSPLSGIVAVCSLSLSAMSAAFMGSTSSISTALTLVQHRHGRGTCHPSKGVRYTSSRHLGRSRWAAYPQVPFLGPERSHQMKLGNNPVGSPTLNAPAMPHQRLQSR
jgi:hypothetical protein